MANKPVAEIDVDGSASGLLLRQFDHARENELLLDLRIKVGERVFNAHKVLLAIRAPAFYMQHADEFITGSTAVITDMDFTTMSRFLDYVYTGKVSSTRNAFDLYAVAERYSLSALAQALEKLAVQQFNQQKELISPKNCIPLWSVANKLAGTTMKDFLTSFIQKEFDTIPVSHILSKDLVKHLAQSVENDQIFSELYRKCLNANRSLQDRMNFLKLLDFSELTKSELASITDHPCITRDELRHIVDVLARPKPQVNGEVNNTSEPAAKKIKVAEDVRPRPEQKQGIGKPLLGSTSDLESKKRIVTMTVKEGKPVLTHQTFKEFLKPVQVKSESPSPKVAIAPKKESPALQRRTIPVLVTFNTLSTINSNAEKVVVQWTFDKNSLRNENVWRSSHPHENICSPFGCPGCDCINMELITSTLPADFKHLATIRLHMSGDKKVLYFVFKRVIEISSKRIYLEFTGSESKVWAATGVSARKPTMEKDLGQFTSHLYVLNGIAADRCEFTMNYAKPKDHEIQ